MCGIAGFVRTCSPQADRKILKRMGAVMAHRGPDADGEYLDPFVGLAHRRLSIIDLSEAGTQPMVSDDGRWTIVFNGEIYNFRELRSELQKSGWAFRTRTDTEVILALYAQEGSNCLARLNGMFAFAVWDKKNRTLFLARDRIGKKPLYYYHGGGNRLAFASEIKALLELPGIPREIEPTAIVDYLKYLYIPAPKTIFNNIFKLLPGHFLELNLDAIPVVRSYWDIDFSRRIEGSVEDVAEELHALIGESTRERLVADVPLGAFLSGGIDSSAVVALMAGASQDKVKTCTVGFSDKNHDETPFARQIAQLFDTDHREFFVRENLVDTLHQLSRYFDEPFADSSAVPTFHVSRLARQAVTVALAGDGGDENFGGYDKYVTELRENRVRQMVPKTVLGWLCRGVSHGEGRLQRKARTLTNSALSDPAVGYYRTNTFIGDDDLDALLSPSLRKACRGYRPSHHTDRYWNRLAGADHVSRMLYTDLKTYLPGDILVKVDRMSMAHSLEVRAPLLDYRVIEFAASLPSCWKIRGSSKKIILKKAFSKVLPSEILNRQKHGFTVPLGAWFRGGLRQLAEERILEDSAMGNYFSFPRLQALWDAHQSERQDHGTLLFSLLSFALWHRMYLGNSSAEAVPATPSRLPALANG